MVRTYEFHECIDILSRYLVPTDFHPKYSLTDAMTYLAQQWSAGEVIFMGDLENGVLFRGMVMNPKVIEIHIMGNARRMRSVGLECKRRVFDMGYEQLVISTQHKQLADIAKRLGFEQRGHLPRYHWDGVALQDLFIFCLEKPHGWIVRR